MKKTVLIIITIITFLIFCTWLQDIGNARDTYDKSLKFDKAYYQKWKESQIPKIPQAGVYEHEK